jgi:hypothetical protein
MKGVSESQLVAIAEAAGYRNNTEVQERIRALFLSPEADDLADAAELVDSFSLEAKLKGRSLHPFLPSPPSQVISPGDIPIGRIPGYRETVFIPAAGHK